MSISIFRKLNSSLQVGNLSPVTFTTHLVPMTRGIMTTIYGKMKTGYAHEDQLLDLYKRITKINRS